MQINKNDNLKVSVHIFATSRCNLNCKHCFIGASNKNKIISDLPSQLIAETVNNIGNYWNDVEYEIEGGEITLHPDFYGILDKINPTLLSKVVITTNGCQSIDLNRFKKYKGLKLRVSIEGYNQKKHEILRSSNIEDQLQLVSQASKYGIDTIIRTTLHSENVEYIEEMINVFKLTGTHKVQFLEFQEVGRGADKDNNSLLLNNSTFCDLVDKFSQLDTCDIEKVSLSVSDNRLQSINKLCASRLPLKKDITPKKNISIVVNWNGSISTSPWEPFKSVISQEYPNNISDFIIEKLAKKTMFRECGYCSVLSLLRKNNELSIQY